MTEPMTKPDLMAELAEGIRLRKAARRNPNDEYTIEGSQDSVRYIRHLIGMFANHHAELEAVVRDVARYAPCLWVPDDDTDSWDTACGNKHQFTAGDPADNLYQHCPYCGGKLVEPNTDTTAMHNSAREG